VIRTLTADLLLDCRQELAESPLWDSASGVIRWVDIPAGVLHQLDPATGRHDSTSLDAPLSNVALADDGTLVLAGESGVYRYDESSGDNRLLWSVEGQEPRTRLNDGAADPAGRLLIGTMAYDATSPLGVLYALEASGQRSLLHGVTISNGLGWSPDKATLYYADTPTGRVDAFHYDVDEGAIHDRRPFAAVPTDIGAPDGLAVDGDGCVWVALWGGGALHRYTPKGALDTVVTVPARYVTSCAFSGTDRDNLVITTARDSTDHKESHRYPHAGGLFTITPGTVGLGEHRVRVGAPATGTLQPGEGARNGS
jgi:sugar lactone lactonase YvrE